MSGRDFYHIITKRDLPVVQVLFGIGIGLNRVQEPPESVVAHIRVKLCDRIQLLFHGKVTLEVLKEDCACHGTEFGYQQDGPGVACVLVALLRQADEEWLV